jgi:hypothetical protein
MDNEKMNARGRIRMHVEVSRKRMHGAGKGEEGDIFREREMHAAWPREYECK